MFNILNMYTQTVLKMLQQAVEEIKRGINLIKQDQQLSILNNNNNNVNSNENDNNNNSINNQARSATSTSSKKIPAELANDEDKHNLELNNVNNNTASESVKINKSTSSSLTYSDRNKETKGIKLHIQDGRVVSTRVNFIYLKNKEVGSGFES